MMWLVSEVVSYIESRLDPTPGIDWERKAEIDRQWARRYAIERLPIDVARKSVSGKPS